MLGDGDDDLNAPEGSDDTYCVLDSGTESEEIDLDDLDVSDADSSGSDTIDEEDDDMYAKEERHFADSFLNSIGGHDSVLAGDIIGPALKDLGTTGWHDPETPNVTQYLQTPYTPVPSSDEYPDLMGERGGPTEEALKRGASPIALFFMFIPVALWQHIAECSNLYMHEQLDARVDAYFERKEQQAQKARRAGRAVQQEKNKTRRDVRQEFHSVKPIMPHELCVYIGLLIARTIMPNREKLANHWRLSEQGALPRGTFGKFLSRDRFMQLTQNLHFTSNQDPRAKTDRVWKIRSVVNVLQQTFVQYFNPPAELSFDEAMLPNRSSFNRTRVYMKDKPHKWGTKLFMLCCAVSAYCIR